MLQFPPWKVALILFVSVFGALFALPNVLKIFEEAGGIIQPIVVDEKKLKKYVE